MKIIPNFQSANQFTTNKINRQNSTQPKAPSFEGNKNSSEPLFSKIKIPLAILLCVAAYTALTIKQDSLDKRLKQAKNYIIDSSDISKKSLGNLLKDATNHQWLKVADSLKAQKMLNSGKQFAKDSLAKAGKIR